MTTMTKILPNFPLEKRRKYVILYTHCGLFNVVISVFLVRFLIVYSQNSWFLVPALLEKNNQLRGKLLQEFAVMFQIFKAPLA